MIEELYAIPGIRTTATAEADLAALVQDYAPLLYRVAHSILRNPAEAEDTVQDTFVRVLEHQHKLPMIRETRVWLIRITWNLALDRRRRIRPQQIDELFAQSLTAHDIPADQALRQAQQMSATMRSIDALPKAERQVVLLAAMEELSTTEIAGIMNKSESAVRSLLHRARTHLRERLKKAGHA